jgi:ABC-type Na+ transport system ATPase subunit NatA
MAVIKARGLARTFTSRRRSVDAVRGVDLEVFDSEIVGFLGPNGAGKTTTLRMLTTVCLWSLRASSCARTPKFDAARPRPRRSGGRADAYYA